MPFFGVTGVVFFLLLVFCRTMFSFVFILFPLHCWFRSWSVLLCCFCTFGLFPCFIYIIYFAIQKKSVWFLGYVNFDFWLLLVAYVIHVFVGLVLIPYVMFSLYFALIP